MSSGSSELTTSIPVLVNDEIEKLFGNFIKYLGSLEQVAREVGQVSEQSSALAGQNEKNNRFVLE